MSAVSAELGKGDIKKLLIKLSVPAITAQLVNALYNIVDRIYIGHMPEVGDLALTGLGLCMPVIMIMSAFAGLMAQGGAPLAAIYMGKNESKNAENLMGNCFAMLLLSAVALTIIVEIFKTPLLLLIGASENTLSYAQDYLRVYAIGTVSVLIALGMNPFINAQGFSKVGMKTVLIGAGLNIALDPIFIFALDLGVVGAALATIISQTASALWVVLFLFGKKSALKLRLKNMRLKSVYVKPAISMGLSPFTMMSTEGIISLVLNSTLARTGGDIAVGSMTVITSIMQFIFLPMNGLGQGAQPIISFNFGAKAYDRVKECYKAFLFAAVAFTLTASVIVLTFARPIAGIFAASEALVEYTAPMMRIYFCMMVAMGVQISCQQTFLATGQAKISLFLAMLRKIVLLAPLAVIFAQIWGVRGVYTAEPVADLTAATVTFIIFIKRRKYIFGEKG